MSSIIHWYTRHAVRLDVIKGAEPWSWSFSIDNVGQPGSHGSTRSAEIALAMARYEAERWIDDLERDGQEIPTYLEVVRT